MQYHELLELVAGFFGIGVATLGVVHYLASRSRLGLLAGFGFLFGGSLLTFEVLSKLFPVWKSLGLPAVSGIHARLLFGGLLVAALLIDRVAARGALWLGWLAAFAGAFVVFSLPLPPKLFPEGIWGMAFVTRPRELLPIPFYVAASWLPRAHPANSGSRFSFSQSIRRAAEVSVIGAVFLALSRSSEDPFGLAAHGIQVLAFFLPHLGLYADHIHLFSQERRAKEENARLFRATRTQAEALAERNRQFSFLHLTARFLSTEHDPTRLLQRMVESAAGLIGARYGALAVFGGDGKIAKFFTEGIDAETRERIGHPPEGRGLLGHVFREGKTLRMDDLTAHPQAAGLPPHHPVMRNLLAVPIRYQEKILGALYLTEKEGGFTADDEEILTTLCADAAVAVENARLYEEMSRRQDRMEILSVIARYLTTIREVEQIMPRIAGAAAELMDGDGAGVRLMEGDDLVVAARVGVAEEVTTSDRIKIGESLTGRVMAEGRPIAIADLEADPTDLLPLKIRARAAGVHSLLAVPLRSMEGTIGALVVHFKARREFSQEEISLLSAFTDQATLAVQNARLFDETRRQKSELEQIFNSTSDGIVTLDPTGCVVSANHRAEELLGLTGSAAGCPMEVLGLNAADAGRIEEEFRALLAEPERGEEGDLEITEPVHRLLHWVARPTLDPEKRPVGVTLTFRDVTREREVDRMKTEFISTVSHELRTPLTSIKGALQLVMEEPEFGQNPMAEELLTICFSNTERLIRLINDILDISKIEAGRIQLKLDSHQVEEIVVSAVEGVRSFAAQRQVQLISDVSAGLPPVVVDLDRMIQVVTNLLSNAIKFSPEGSTVWVEARAAAGEVEVRVRDQGEGISPEDVQKLFKKFNQLDGSAVREVGGTGLGLAICKGIVEEHRGRIWVESEMGKGATFIFRLPVAGAAGLKSRKILVADDDPEMRQAVGDLLRHEVASLDLEFAVDGTEAMLRIGQFAPDLLILDNRMPGLDGIAVCRRIRESPGLRGIKILGVTGFTEDLPLLNEAGADESLAKPLDLAELRAAIARLLEPGPAREKSTPPASQRLERLPKGVHRILVVDDEPDIRYILRQHLERQGYQVVEATSGLEALEKSRALQPDLITLDVMMPDMDGFDVMKVLRGSEETSRIPVIFLSIVQDEAKGLKLGASDYLTKPIDPERLLATVSRALSREEAQACATVLVIDDDPDIVQVLSHTLSRAGYRVATATSGADGLTRLFHDIPSLVILDLKMPGMSGYEVIKQVRSTRRVAQIPILVLTASDVGEGRERALALGANEYLRKPVSTDQLLAEISRLVHTVEAPAGTGVTGG